VLISIWKGREATSSFELDIEADTSSVDFLDRALGSFAPTCWKENNACRRLDSLASKPENE